MFHAKEGRMMGLFDMKCLRKILEEKVIQRIRNTDLKRCGNKFFLEKCGPKSPKVVWSCRMEKKRLTELGEARRRAKPRRRWGGMR